MLRRDGFAAAVRCPDGCTATLRVLRGRHVLARTTKRARPSSRRAAHALVRLTHRGRRVLRPHRGRLRLTLPGRRARAVRGRHAAQRARAAALRPPPWRSTAGSSRAIFAGGFLGAAARALTAEALPQDPSEWPWAIFAVNLAGAFVLGYVATRLPRSDYRRSFIGTGFCGALTTFSTMQIELLGDARR